VEEPGIWKTPSLQNPFDEVTSLMECESHRPGRQRNFRYCGVVPDRNIAAIVESDGFIALPDAMEQANPDSATPSF
jgi:hypothetical protein